MVNGAAVVLSVVLGVGARRLHLAETPLQDALPANHVVPSSFAHVGSGLDPKNAEDVSSEPYVCPADRWWYLSDNTIHWKTRFVFSWLKGSDGIGHAELNDGVQETVKAGAGLAALDEQLEAHGSFFDIVTNVVSKAFLYYADLDEDDNLSRNELYCAALSARDFGLNCYYGEEHRCHGYSDRHDISKATRRSGRSMTDPSHYMAQRIAQLDAYESKMAQKAAATQPVVTATVLEQKDTHSTTHGKMRLRFRRGPEQGPRRSHRSSRMPARLFRHGLRS